MKKFFKGLGIVTLILSTLIGAYIYSNFGIYDHRNFPAKIHISSKTGPGLHVHLHVQFYRDRDFRGICTALIDISGEGRSLGANVYQFYDDIPATGIDIELKRNYAEFCRYKMESLNISCSKTVTFPGDAGTNHNLVIFPTKEPNSGYVEFPSQNNPNIYEPPYNGHRITNNQINILHVEPYNYFFLCKKNCEESEYAAIDSTDKLLNVTCTEDKNAF